VEWPEIKPTISRSRIDDLALTCYWFLLMLRLSNRRSKSNFFLKIELNQNRFFGWHFFDFDSWLYWRRQRAAASSKHDSWAVAKSAEYADLIIRIACRGGHGRAVLLLATAASRCRVATPPTPVSLTQSLLSPSYVLRGRATACNWYLHPRVL